jgi:5'-nucleotidase
MPTPILLPRILVTNDDGIDSPGIKILIDVAKEFAKEIWVIAPSREKSGAGQSISLCDSVRCAPQGEKRWAIDGTPCDCVALALGHFMAKAKPSLVLSGVNPGANIGDEVNMSGTIGAAFTALMLDVPAIAISQACVSHDKAPWDTTRTILPKVLQSLLSEGWRKDTCLSVNIPDLPTDDISGFSWARQSLKSMESIVVEKRTSPRQEDYFWLSLKRKTPVSTPNSEAAILRRKEVAVTVLALDRSLDTTKPSVSFSESDPLADDE